MATKKKSPSFLLRGVDQGPADLPGTQQVSITRARRVVVGDAARGAKSAAPVEVANDELVRIGFGDGRTLWMRADELRQLRGSVSADRSAGAAEVVELDDGSQADERGVAKVAIKVLDFFGIDVKKKAASLMASGVDSKQLKVDKPGIYRCSLESSPPLSPLKGGEGPPSGQPLLVFIHGTFSNFEGGYGGLLDRQPGEAGRPAAELRAAIARSYGDRVFAFEHHTLSESPIANALMLVQALPQGARLHLVTHSRGGLIGELLALSGRLRQNDPLDDDLIQRLFLQDPAKIRPPGLQPLDDDDATRLAEAYRQDATRLRELIRLLDEKQVQVTRFVRVACPARGTTLASGRLDRWLGLLQSLVPESFVGDALDFLLAVLKERTDARVMPGIEAMMPGSALTRLLNLSGITTGADLSVIAGDTQGSGFFKRLKVFVADWFYGSENDLVVNTGSMSGGLARVPGAARALQAQGAEVTHTSYFRQPQTLGWLLSGLMRTDGQSGGYLSLDSVSHELPRWRSSSKRSASQAARLPIVVFVPGAMGSELTVDNSLVWVKLRALMFGGMSRLAIDAPNVSSPAPLAEFYGPLLDHLERSHRVEPFAYDWRLSVAANAKLLADRLKPLVEQAESQGVALHLAAHSMGGLVARSMIADGGAGAELWARMGRLAGGSRLLMLGTPNHGSHEAVRWLTGFNPTQAKLTLIDLTQGVNGLIDIVRRYPGLVELLPFGDDNTEARFGERDFWRQLRDETKAGFPIADQAVLTQARSVWTRLRGQAVDPERMFYVAGCAPATVVDHELPLDEDTPTRKRIAWIASPRGDGTVSWESGRLPGIKTWYAPDTEHDRLCANSDDTRIFRAYVDLLAAGQTDQLEMSEPAGVRSARARFELVQPIVDAVPTEDELRVSGLGGGKRRRARVATQAPIKLRVRHANLSYANHAVVVGHYQGDVVVSAEAVIDRMLGNALTRSHTMGIYPGKTGSAMSFFGEPATAGRRSGLAGAVVLGLGQVGDLTPARLRATARDAMVDHARQSLNGSGAGSPRQSLGFSCLLVGTGGAGLSVHESIEALLRAALDANRRLEAARLDERVLIDQIEFVELFEDLAVTAAQALDRVLKTEDLRDALTWEPRVAETDQAAGGLKRRSFDTDRSWDQRVEILEDDKTGMLQFSFAGQRARAEQQLSTGQIALAEAFIARAVGDAAADSDVAKTLFEMLLPVEFRLGSADARGLVLMLDERSARFPWELLEDRWSLHGRPLAIDAGVLRQLKTVDYRPAPLQAHDKSILIVGDPDLEGWPSFPQLDGARREAAAVNERFDKAWGREPGAKVKLLQGSKVQPILSALHSDAWRVLHLAGHGEHRWRETPDAPERSGMIVGKGVFLAAGDVAQVRHVPELVFVNCCHLGRTDGRVPDFARMAANIGSQFIAMGARAVVAAGWAVHDGSAVTFAQTFYDALLGGQTFRDAVRRAREETHQRHPDTNTWGAYQCYGDPGWRLVDTGSAGSGAEERAYVSPRELLVDLENEVVRQKGYSAGADADSRSKALTRLVEACQRRVPQAVRSDWFARADIAAATGFMYSEAGDFGQAIEWLNRALRAPTGDCPLAAMDGWANLSVRETERRWDALRTDPAGASDEALEALRASIRQVLTTLQLLAEHSPTLDRLSLVGSAYKRLTWMSPGPDRIEALLQMAGHYRRAFETGEPKAYYPLPSWAAACALLERASPEWAQRCADAAAADADGHGWRQHMHALIDRTAKDDEERLRLTPEFWRAAGQGDLAVARMLLDADEPQKLQTHAAQAAQLYAAALLRGASERERNSMRRHLEFLAQLAEEPGSGWPAALAVELRGLCSNLG